MDPRQILDGLQDIVKEYIQGYERLNFEETRVRLLARLNDVRFARTGSHRRAPALAAHWIPRPKYKQGQQQHGRRIAQRRLPAAGNA